MRADHAPRNVAAVVARFSITSRHVAAGSGVIDKIMWDYRDETLFKMTRPIAVPEHYAGASHWSHNLAFRVVRVMAMVRAL